MKNILLAASTMLLVLLFTSSAFAQDYTFYWTINPDVVSYKLYYKKGGDPAPPYDGTEAINGISPVNIGYVNTINIDGLEPNTRYHFALSSINAKGEESALTSPITVFPTEDDLKNTDKLNIPTDWQMIIIATLQ